MKEKLTGDFVLLWAKRFLIYCLGLFIMACGVVFSVKSSLGVSPVTCLANVLYQIMSDRGNTLMTLGVCTFVSYFMYVVVELIILRKDFQPQMLLQLVASFFFSVLVTLATSLFAWLPAPTTYPMRMVFLLISVPLVALGVMLYLAPGILPTPGEGMSIAISMKTGLTVASSKTVFDCTMVVISALTSLVYFHGLVGVREGTVICAILVGQVMKLFQKVLEQPVKHFVGRDTKKEQIMGHHVPVYQTDVTGKPKVLVTVSWEYGSGGYEIAKELAARLKLHFYGNDELIPMEAEESNLEESFIHQHENTMATGVVHNFLLSQYDMTGELSPLEKLFAAQVRVQRRIASEDESALIVGRCSNYILDGNPNAFHVFIHAPTDNRVKWVANSKNISEESARTELRNTDASRARHYKHFTERNWGDTKYYNLAVDTGKFGTEACLDLIDDAIRHWNEARMEGTTKVDLDINAEADPGSAQAG